MTNHNTNLTNGPGQPLRSFSSTVTSKYPSCTRKNALITELETSARTERKRMTNHNTLQLSRMDLANQCAAFPGLSLLNTLVVFPLPTGCSSPTARSVIPTLQQTDLVLGLQKRSGLEPGPHTGYLESSLVFFLIFSS
jgi:hypothetical protein